MVEKEFPSSGSLNPNSLKLIIVPLLHLSIILSDCTQHAKLLNSAQQNMSFGKSSKFPYNRQSLQPHL